MYQKTSGDPGYKGGWEKILGQPWWDRGVDVTEGARIPYG